MQLDATQFPLVVLREHDQKPSHREAEAAFAALLDRGERFVLLTDHLPGDDHGHDEDHEDRRQRALFFKRNKQRLKELCAGVVIITGDRAIPAAARLALQTLSKVLGFSSTFVRDEQEAQEQASKLLLRCGFSSQPQMLQDITARSYGPCVRPALSFNLPVFATLKIGHRRWLR